MNLTDDPRWRRFNDRAFQCPCCGKSFNGIFDIGYDHPDPWPHQKFRDNGGLDVKVGDDVLGSDICIAQDAFFVRGLIEIPIIGSDAHFAFGVWSSLKKENFAAYLRAYGTDAELEMDPCFGWVCNDLPLYGIDDALKSEVSFRGGGKRPSFHVWDERTRLGHDQREGISFDQLLDLYAASGTDIRPHLMDG